MMQTLLQNLYQALAVLTHLSIAVAPALSEDYLEPSEDYKKVTENLIGQIDAPAHILDYVKEHIHEMSYWQQDWIVEYNQAYLVSNVDCVANRCYKIFFHVDYAAEKSWKFALATYAIDHSQISDLENFFKNLDPNECELLYRGECLSVKSDGFFSPYRP